MLFPARVWVFAGVRRGLHGDQCQDRGQRGACLHGRGQVRRTYNPLDLCAILLFSLFTRAAPLYKAIIAILVQQAVLCACVIDLFCVVSAGEMHKPCPTKHESHARSDIRLNSRIPSLLRKASGGRRLVTSVASAFGSECSLTPAVVEM